MLVHNFLRKAVVVGAMLAMPGASFAQISIGISVNIAPPALPVYVQPACPAPNYLWAPGYWAWNANYGDYYWVPGTWVAAPQPGYLWTPGYWGWGNGGVYLFHAGYWGTQVGFYGGVNYGFGFGGVGFVGGAWRGGNFAYNTAVVNVNTTVVHNTYVNTTVVNNTTIVNNNRTSFNGGPNGVAATPTPQERAFASQPHMQATPAQLQHEQVASQDRSNFSAVNHGTPAHAAVARPVANVAELQHAAVPARPVAAARTAAPNKPAGFTPAASHPAPVTQTANHPAARAVPAQKPAPEKRAAAHRPPPKESKPERR